MSEYALLHIFPYGIKIQKKGSLHLIVESRSGDSEDEEIFSWCVFGVWCFSLRD